MKLKRKLKKTMIGGGKQIVPWVERLSYFNQYFPKFTTETEIAHIDNNFVSMRGVVKDETGKVIADGIAHKKLMNLFHFKNAKAVL